MSLNDYKLCAELFGHSLDVRAVCEGQAGSLISGSRDKTAKIWTQDGGVYHEGLTLSDHKNFVSAVCVLEGDGSLICTGSNDSTICVYAPGNTVPLAVLRGHTGTVCSLAPGIEPNTLVSGSWDKTARVWTIAGFGPSVSMTLVGHEAAVWAVATLPGAKQFVTGSADKTICYWNLCGEKLKVLKGHTDCVRGLVGLADGGLVSCANDALVKWWNADGECVSESHGHANYIYSIAPNASLGADVCVTGGEDSTIRMWSRTGGPLGEPITLPAQSVWSVACLRNGDIVTGTSDGVVRVFTRDRERYASAAVQQAFQVAVQSRIAEASMELGGVKVNDLPGPESLLTEGTDGQTRIVRQPDGKIMCYQWSAGEWLLVGDVTGAAGGSQKKSGKVLFEGQEYDYVFSVDISDSGAPIKLPYNCADEPWLVAQKFLHRHELPQAYLEQVANFIIKNSADGAPTAQNPSTGFEDPFTGGGRYIPGSSTSHHNGSSGDMVDPFTGASSYRSAAAAASASSNGTQPRVDVQITHPSTGRSVKHFPHTVYTTFSACDPSKVLVKIREFNQNVAAELKVADATLDNVIQLTHSHPTDLKTSVVNLEPLLLWPKEVLFPVLDVVRLAVRSPEACSLLAARDSFVDLIVDSMSHGPAANQLMAVRCFANMMSHDWGRRTVEKRIADIVGKLNATKAGSPNLQVAIASLYLNLTVGQCDAADQDVCHQLTVALLKFLRWAHDAESFYRAYQALGNLACSTYGPMTSAQIVSDDRVINRLRDDMSAAQAPGMEKLNEVARALTDAL